MNLKVTKAVLCAALFFFSKMVLADPVITEHGALTVTCYLQNAWVKLQLTTQDQKGSLQLTSSSGNRMYSTITTGSLVNYSLNIEQFPVTVVYETSGQASEFMIASDCAL